MFKWIEKLIRKEHTRQYIKIRDYEFRQFRDKYVLEIWSHLFRKYNNQSVICEKCNYIDKKKKVTEVNNYGKEVVKLICNKCGTIENKLRDYDYKYKNEDFYLDIKSLAQYGWTRGLATEKLEEMAIEFFSNRFEYEVLRPYIGVGSSKFELPLVKDIPTSVMKKYARDFFKKIY